MKILYVHSSGDNLAGSEMVLLGMLESFHRKYRLEVLLPKNGVFFDRLNQLGVMTHIADLPIFCRKHPLRFLKTIWNFLIVLLKIKPDLIHTTSASSIQYAYPVTRLLRIPLICHIQTSYDADDLRRFFPHRADRLILISDTLRRAFPQHCRKKISVVYNAVKVPPIDKQAARSRIDAEFGLPSNASVVGMVGQIIHRKGIDVFIKAVAALSETTDNVNILMVGNDQNEYALRMKEMAEKLGIGNKMIWSGFRFETQELMAGMDVLVVPSRNEAFGLVAAEALAVGTPVIAARTGGLVEIVDDGFNGFLIPSEDHRELSRRLGFLLANPAIATDMGDKGREKIIERFSGSEHETKIEAIYRTLLITKSAVNGTTHQGAR